MHDLLRHAATSVVVFATAVGALGACRSKKTETTSVAVSAPSASQKTDPKGIPGVPKVEYRAVDAGALATGIPLPAASVDGALNPSGLPAYAGPVGIVEGVVKVRGPKAPDAPVEPRAECADAKAFYGKLFREGAGRSLADALVSVTDYQGYLPSRGDVVPVTIRGCAFDRRTYDVTFGQHIEVSNKNAKLSFVPDLAGANMPAQMIAMPRGDAVKLYPLAPGYYELNDQMQRTWMTAAVYVVKFPTHTVTGIDGRFRITGVPVGKVKVSVLEPHVGDHADRVVEVKDGAATRADFELTYKPKPPAPARADDEPNIR
jgi:hypothetical protein